jgi:hypothetical protein
MEGIEMNMNSDPTIQELRELIRRCDDSATHHVLWVKKNGDVELSRIPKNVTSVGFGNGPRDMQDMQVRFETFQAGNEYVGPEAADDDEWVSELFDRLIEKWHQAKDRSEVVYVDAF